MMEIGNIVETNGGNWETSWKTMVEIEYPHENQWWKLGNLIETNGGNCVTSWKPMVEIV